MNSPQSASAMRPIVLRTAGQRHGPITRLMSPGDVGAWTKPFVFLDYMDAPAGSGPNFGFHPHSGIATLTFPLSFDIQHETSAGQIDVVHQGGIEWVQTGGGIWHRAQPRGNHPIRGFQLWFALPPSHEGASASARFVQPDQVPKVGPVTVLHGSLGEVHSPLNTPVAANYLWVSLTAGERWTYVPPAGHDVAWAFSPSDAVSVNGAALDRELVVFAEGDGELVFEAQSDAGVLLGSAVKHPHDLVLGHYSVHTSAEALANGEAHIAEIGRGLRQDGRL